MSSKVSVLQLIDSLDPGGAERVAVNLANLLPRDRFRSALGTTRRDGALAAAVAADVTRLRLARRGRFDLAAVVRLAAFLRRERIDLVHAHSTSLFIAVAAAALGRRTAVVWHDHFGASHLRERPAWLYQLPVRAAGAVVAVNPRLAAWSRERLGVAAERVSYLPNFVTLAPAAGDAAPPALPGRRARRIVCVANLRPQKGHTVLLQAMARVAAEVPDSHLLAVGAAAEPAYRAELDDAVRRLGLEARVSFLGVRQDVAAILRASAIGVLSSLSEGMPIALLEYGAAGLAAVATEVGKCAEILDHGRCGVLVPAGDPAALAAALVTLLQQPAEAGRLAAALQRRIADTYSDRAILPRLCETYARVLERPDIAG